MVSPRSVEIDPVMRVVEYLAQSRDVAMVRRFVHGSGGTSLVRVDGVALVLKAWGTPSLLSTHLPAALERMSRMRGRGVPAPAVVEHGVADGNEFLMYEVLPGRWPGRVTSGVPHGLLMVVDAERDAAAECVGGTTAPEHARTQEGPRRNTRTASGRVPADGVAVETLPRLSTQAPARSSMRIKT